MSTVRISTNGLVATNATIQVDGHDLAPAVRGFRLDGFVNEITRLDLDIALTKVAQFDGEAVVGFSHEFTELLVGLGWTPPAAEMGA